MADRKGQQDAADASGSADQQRLAKNHGRDMMSLKTQGLEDRVLSDPLPGGHGHGVGHHGHDDDDDHIGNNLDRHHDGLGHGGKTLLKGHFCLRQGFGQGILEDPVNILGYLGGQVRTADADDIETGLISPPGNRLFKCFVQVIPLKKENPFLGVLFGPAKDAPQYKLPLAGKDRPFQDQLVAQFPAVSCGQLFPDNTALAVADKGLLLILRENKLGIQLQKTLRLNGLVGEKILFIDIDAAEPVAIGNVFDSRYLANSLIIGDRQRKDERDGIAGHQAGRHRALDTNMPQADYGPEQTKGENGDRNSKNRQARAQTVAQGIAEENLKDEHRPSRLYQDTG